MGLPWCVALLVTPRLRVWSQRAYSVQWLSSPSPAHKSPPSPHLWVCEGSPPTGALAGSCSFWESATVAFWQLMGRM